MYQHDQITETIQDSIDRVLETGNRQIYHEILWLEPKTDLERRLQDELRTLQDEVAELIAHFNPVPMQIH